MKVEILMNLAESELRYFDKICFRLRKIWIHSINTESEIINTN